MSYKFRIAFSRFVDYALLYLAGIFLSFLSPIYIDPVYYLVFAILLPFLWAPLEVFLIHKVGVTPGSWLFGIRYREEAHYFKRYKRALWRERKQELIEIRSSQRRTLVAYISSVAIILSGIFSPFFYQMVTTYVIQPTIKGWVRYDAPQGVFNVDFPTEPYHAIKALAIPITRTPIEYSEYKSFLDEDPLIAYSVSFIPLPLKVRFYGDKTILRACFGYIPENGPTTKVLKEELIPFKRYSALAFSVRNGEELTEGMLVLANGILFKLAVNYPEEREDSTLDVEQFLNSFFIPRKLRGSVDFLRN